MNKYWVAMLWAWIGLCLTFTTALAQNTEETVPYCGGLTTEECAALDAVAEKMAALNSGTSETQTKIYLTGGPLQDQEVSMQLSTSRTFVIQPERLRRLLEIKAMTPAMLEADPAAAAELLHLLLAINTDQTTVVAFSPALLALLGERLGAEIPATLAFHTRMIDHVLYIRLADYAAFGTQPAWVPEWVGIQLTSILSDSVATTVAEPDFNIKEAQAGLEAPGAAMASSVVYDVPPQQLAAYADFMDLTLLGTTQIDGRPVKSYQLVWDIPRYVGGPLFAEQLGLATQGHPSPASLMLGTMASVLLHGLEAEMIQTVGVESGYLYEATTRVEWTLAVAGGPALAASPTVGFTNTIINRDLDSVEAIPVPEEAVVPPVDLLLQLFRGINH